MRRPFNRSSHKSPVGFFVLCVCLLASRLLGQWHATTHLTVQAIPHGLEAVAATHADHGATYGAVHGHAATPSTLASHEPGSSDCQVLDHLLLSAATLGQAPTPQADGPSQTYTTQAQPGPEGARRYARLARGPPHSSST